MSEKAKTDSSGSSSSEQQVFIAVARGRKIGVYNSLAEVASLIEGINNPQVATFSTKFEAADWIEEQQAKNRAKLKPNSSESGAEDSAVRSSSRVVEQQILGAPPNPDD